MKTNEQNITVNPERITQLLEKAEPYSRKVAQVVSKKDYTKHESSLAVAADEKYQRDVQKKIAHLKGARKVVLIGIGGSNLGAEAVYHALALRTNPTLHVFDTIEEEALNQFASTIDTIESDSELAVVVVSKSGSTTETVTNAVSILETLEKLFGKEVVDRVVFVGSKETAFLKLGKKKKVTTVTFPESIGGRYSVFTAVGIVPLTLLSIDIDALLEGAHEATSKKYREETVRHAASLVALAEQGVHTVNFFTFNTRLKILGFWYRQLLAESIGKQMTTDGATFSHQLLPTVASAVDLHSMAQLYLGGYKGLFTHFVYADTESTHHALTNHWLIAANTQVEGHTPKEIKDAIRAGVFKAYDEQILPYRVTELPKISAYEVGLFMGSMLFEVMCLGHLFDVDAFDQPNVESYKSFTRELLEK